MSTNFKTFAFVQIGVVGGIVAAICLRIALDGPQPIPVAMLPPPAHAEAPKDVYTGPSVAQVVEKHFQWAQEQEAAGIAPQLTPITELFAEARLGTRAFAQEALGGWSKWYYVKGFVTRGDEHRRYLEERFQAHVFAPETLEKTVQLAVRTYLDHLDNIDAMLLVHLNADLETIPASKFAAGVDRQAIEQSLNSAVGQAVKAVQAEIPGMIGREIASMIAGDILATASLELATSGGILGAGVGTGAMSAGVSLVVALVVDAAVSWAYDRYFDPAGELSRQLDGTLSKLEEFIVTGDYEHPGLCVRLHDYAIRHAEARNAAIKAVLMPDHVAE